MKKRLFAPRLLLLALLPALGLSLCHEAAACTTVMAGRKATEDGAVLMSSSCDGDIMGLIYVMPSNDYPEGTKLPMYWNLPRPRTHAEYLSNLRKGYTMQCLKQVGYAYHELVDYLMFQYLLDHAEVAPPRLPVVGVPAIPDQRTTTRE